MNEQYKRQEKDPLFDSDFLMDIGLDKITNYDDLILAEKINILSEK